MRVLHVLDHSIPLHSGYTFRTLALLNGQRQLGWETFHLTSPKQGARDAPEEQVEGWKFYRCGTEPHGGRRWPGVDEVRLMRRLERRLQEVAEQVRPHILHAHSPVLNAIPALRVGRRLGIPVAYEVRAFWEDAAVDHGTSTEGGMRYRASRLLESYALRRAGHVFTICEGLRTDIVGRGLPESKVTVIPNAVDAGSFAQGGEPDRELVDRHGLAGAAVIGFIGSFYAYEGLELLIGVLPRIRKVMPNVRVLLVGGGPEEVRLKAQARTMGVDEHIVFAGRVPHDDVPRYYDLIDVLVYPRFSMRLTELVTPLKPLEAMAQGRVLIASNVGGHRELIRDGETGVLFEPGDPQSLADTVLKVLSDRGSWERLRAAGRKFVEQERSWAASVARYRPVYERLAAAHD
jgi:PEP-CTERM/exosortase A-associated glycosyltransferase